MSEKKNKVNFMMSIDRIQTRVFWGSFLNTVFSLRSNPDPGWNPFGSATLVLSGNFWLGSKQYSLCNYVDRCNKKEEYRCKMSKYFIQISGKFELSHWTPPEYLSPIGYKPYYFDVETNYLLHIYVLVTKIRYYSIFDWL